MKYNSDLRKENAMLKNRLKHSLPIHAIFYMVLNSIIFAIVGTLLVMHFLLNVYTIDPYYLICALIISCGLFFTALVSLKDWKDNLSQAKESKEWFKMEMLAELQWNEDLIRRMEENKLCWIRDLKN